MNAARDLLSTLGATFSAVALFFFAQTTVFAPPDPDGMVVLQAVCAFVGILLGAGFLFWRRHASFRPAYVFWAAGIAALIGLISIFVYEGERNNRTEAVTLAGQTQMFIIANRVTPNGERVARANEIVECEGAAYPEVSWPCAAAIVTQAPAAYADAFFRGDIEASRSTLTLWYRITAFGLMLALYLLISQILYERTGARAPTPPPANEPV